MNIVLYRYVSTTSPKSIYILTPGYHWVIQNCKLPRKTLPHVTWTKQQLAKPRSEKSVLKSVLYTVTVNRSANSTTNLYMILRTFAKNIATIFTESAPQMSVCVSVFCGIFRNHTISCLKQKFQKNYESFRNIYDS